METNLYNYYGWEFSLPDQSGSITIETNSSDETSSTIRMDLPIGSGLVGKDPLAEITEETEKPKSKTWQESVKKQVDDNLRNLFE